MGHTLDRAVKIGLELLVELFAGGLVLGILGGTEGIAGIVDPDQIFRLVFLTEAEQEVGDAPRGGGVLALGGAEWPG